MKTRLRQMEPSDVANVSDLCREQNKRDGTSYGVPRIFGADGRRLRSVELALVAESGPGEVAQAHVWINTLEQLSFGIDPKATVCSMHEQDAVLYLLRQRGYTDFHILVPPNRAPDMQHGLERIYGMSATGMVHFYRLLDPLDNDELRAFYQNQIKDERKRTVNVGPRSSVLQDRRRRVTTSHK